MNRDKLPKLTRPTWYWHLLKKKKKNQRKQWGNSSADGGLENN